MFLISLGKEYEAIKAAECLVFDLETTGLTRFSPEIKISKNTKIGNETFTQYKKRTGATADTSPRVRILAAGLPDGTTYAWDLDSLDEEERSELFRAALEGKDLIGQNLSFDLSWATHYTSAKPRRILDTMLLVRTERPGISSAGLNLRAETAKNNSIKAAAGKMLKGFKTAASMAGMSVYFEAPWALELINDKAYQKPANWAVSVLEKGHYDYATGDVLIPVRLAQLLFRDTENKLSAAELMELAYHCPHYRRAAEATICLAQMHYEGMPFSTEKAQAYRDQLIESIEADATALIEAVPSLEPFSKNLHSLRDGTAADLKTALLGELEAKGVKPRDGDGKPTVDVKACKLAGARAVDWFATWERLCNSKKRLGMVSDYLARTESRGRIHGTVGVNCATLRTSAQSPNLQQVPNGPMRELFTAPEGYRLIAADYGQIELRIAAALGIRAVDEIDAAGPGDCKGWVLEALDHMNETGTPWPAPEHAPGRVGLTEQETINAWLDMYRHDLTRGLLEVRRRGFPLAEVFRRGLDPHLATALAMLQRRGEFNTEGVDLIEYLDSLTAEETEEHKERFAADRKAAKAVNFGLLYGMAGPKLWENGITSYGLDWSLEAACEAREAWLDQYPEILVWQVWTKATKKLGRYKMAERGHGGSLRRRDTPLYQVETLAGRKIAATKANSALNYQDQGTGADIALEAVIEAPRDDRGVPVLLVHDELVAVAREEKAEEYAKDLVKTMIEVADRHLSAYDIPVDVDHGIGYTWKH